MKTLETVNTKAGSPSGLGHGKLLKHDKRRVVRQTQHVRKLLVRSKQTASDVIRCMSLAGENMFCFLRRGLLVHRGLVSTHNCASSAQRSLHQREAEVKSVRKKAGSGSGPVNEKVSCCFRSCCWCRMGRSHEACSSRRGPFCVTSNKEVAKRYWRGIWPDVGLSAIAKAFPILERWLKGTRR